MKFLKRNPYLWIIIGYLITMLLQGLLTEKTLGWWAFQLVALGLICLILKWRTHAKRHNI